MPTGSLSFEETGSGAGRGAGSVWGFPLATTFVLARTWKRKLKASLVTFILAANLYMPNYCHPHSWSVFVLGYGFHWFRFVVVSFQFMGFSKDWDFEQWGDFVDFDCYLFFSIFKSMVFFFWISSIDVFCLDNKLIWFLYLSIDLLFQIIVNSSNVFFYALIYFSVNMFWVHM